MKKLIRFILAALLVIAFLCCWLSVISQQRSRIHDMESPEVSGRSIVVPGCVTFLNGSNFPVVLHALAQRNGIQRLPEPEVVTRRHLAINQIYYDLTFTLPVTNK